MGAVQGVLDPSPRVQPAVLLADGVVQGAVGTRRDDWLDIVGIRRRDVE
jgi:hypothetical protein